MSYTETTGPVYTTSIPGLVDSTVTAEELYEGMCEATNRWRRRFLLNDSSVDHLESRDWDAFGHCWMGCECTRRYGVIEAAILSTIYEIMREGGYHGQHDSFSQDVSNENRGRQLAFCSGSPSYLADWSFRTSQLDLTAPLTDEVFTLERGQHTRS